MHDRKLVFCPIVLLFLSQIATNSLLASPLPAAPSQAGQESVYQEIKRKFNIDMRKWLKGPAGELPDTMGNLILNLAGSEYYFANWKSQPFGKGSILRQVNADDRNQTQVVENDKGTIVTLAHAHKKRTGDFIQALLRYGKETYPSFFLEHDHQGGTDHHHFKQLFRDRGMSRSLLYVSDKDSLRVQISQNSLAVMPEAEKSMSAMLSKAFPDIKPEAYLEEGGVGNFYYIIKSPSVDDAYFTKLLNYAAAFTAVEKALRPNLMDWAKSKAFFLFHNRMALGWILAEDLAAFPDIKEADAQQQFFNEMFHNTLTYFLNEFGKNP